MTNPAHLLLVAHLRRQERRIAQLISDLQASYERNAILQRDNKDLRTKIAQLRTSSEAWKGKAITRSRRAIRMRQEARRQWRRAETWKCRALREATAREIDETIDRILSSSETSET